MPYSFYQLSSLLVFPVSQKYKLTHQSSPFLFNSFHSCLIWDWVCKKITLKLDIFLQLYLILLLIYDKILKTSFPYRVWSLSKVLVNFPICWRHHTDVQMVWLLIWYQHILYKVRYFLRGVIRKVTRWLMSGDRFCSFSLRRNSCGLLFTVVFFYRYSHGPSVRYAFSIGWKPADLSKHTADRIITMRWNLNKK